MTNALLPKVTMPQLSGGRDRARTLALPLAGQVAGKQVRLDCRNLVAGTASFADEIVLAVLVEGHADQLLIEYAGDRFATFLVDAARDHGVGERVTFA